MCRFCVLVFILLTFSACGLVEGITPQTDKEKLVAAELVFTKAVDVIVHQYTLGNISDTQLKVAKLIAKSGNELLDGLHEAVKINDSQLVFVLLTELNKIIHQLQLLTAKQETVNHEYGRRYLTDTRIAY